MMAIADGFIEQSELPIEVALFQSNPDLLSKKDLIAVALVAARSLPGLLCSGRIGVRAEQLAVAGTICCNNLALCCPFNFGIASLYVVGGSYAYISGFIPIHVFAIF